MLAEQNRNLSLTNVKTCASPNIQIRSPHEDVVRTNRRVLTTTFYRLKTTNLLKVKFNNYYY